MITVKAGSGFGPFDGEAEGVEVGFWLSLGVAEGEFVGARVGSAEGLVGVELGIGVGASVTVSATNSTTFVSFSWHWSKSKLSRHTSNSLASSSPAANASTSEQTSELAPDFPSIASDKH